MNIVWPPEMESVSSQAERFFAAYPVVEGRFNWWKEALSPSVLFTVERDQDMRMCFCLRTHLGLVQIQPAWSLRIGILPSNIFYVTSYLTTLPLETKDIREGQQEAYSYWGEQDGFNIRIISPMDGWVGQQHAQNLDEAMVILLERIKKTYYTLSDDVEPYLSAQERIKTGET